MTSWQLQDAKSRLSEVIKLAIQEGPQEVIVRGKPSVVIISIEEYGVMKKKRPDFVSLMQNSALMGEDLDVQRDKSLTRDISL